MASLKGNAQCNPCCCKWPPRTDPNPTLTTPSHPALTRSLPHGPSRRSAHVHPCCCTWPPGTHTSSCSPIQSSCGRDQTWLAPQLPATTTCHSQCGFDFGASSFVQATLGTKRSLNFEPCCMLCHALRTGVVSLLRIMSAAGGVGLRRVMSTVGVDVKHTAQ